VKFRFGEIRTFSPAATMGHHPIQIFDLESNVTVSIDQDRSRTELCVRTRSGAQIYHRKEPGPQTLLGPRRAGPKIVTSNFIKRSVRDQNDGKKCGLSCTRMKSKNCVERALMGVTMICWWGCGSCGRKVSNDHMGPCLECGGRIRRIMPAEIAVDVGRETLPYHGAGADSPSIKPNTG
jgi:hypothetical protein